MPRLYKIKNQKNSTSNLFGVIPEEFTPIHSLSREGEKGFGHLFTPGFTPGATIISSLQDLEQRPASPPRRGGGPASYDLKYNVRT
jgi:hypothetical protein